MKKIYNLVILIFAIFFALPTNGQPVNLQKAREIAKNHMSRSNSPELKSATSTSDENLFSPASIVAEQHDTLFYVMNDTLNKRFVIVAADLRSRPILGYSDQGIFDSENAPEAMLQWMDERKMEILDLKSQLQEPDPVLLQQWENLGTTDQYIETGTFSISPLLQTRWNQGCYYNARCPSDPAGQCGRVWAGCVATAIAQVMKYWNHPVTGTGSNSYYHSTYGTQSANFGSTTYQWNNMPAALTSNNDAVATLIYHIGVATSMNYSPSGSGAVLSPSTLVNYFGYSSKAKYVYRTNYSEAAWNSILINELSLLRPVLYRGQSYEGGHAFIIDGINNLDYFHINWGWGGYSDGYFYLGNIEYSSSQAAIIELYPSNITPGTGLQVSRQTVAMGANAATDTLTVTSVAGWTATSDQSWLTISPSSGSAGKTITNLSASENTTTNSRTATVTFTSSGSLPKTVTVTQDKKLQVTAGNLKNLLYGKLTTTTELTLTGTIDARDFKTMRDEMPNLSKVDISRVSILYYEGPDGTTGTNQTTYASNAIPIFGMAGHKALSDIKLPETLVIIDIFAFASCYGLNSIKIPAKVNQINSGALSANLSWIEVDSNNNYFSSLEGLLYNKDRRKLIMCPRMKMGIINIPSTVTTIGEYAFSACKKLDGINIPASVTSIELQPFSSSSGKITVDVNNKYFSSRDGALYNKSFSKLIFCPVNYAGHFRVPLTVSHIGDQAFSGCINLTSLTIHQRIIQIGTRAFSSCMRLKSIFVEPSIPVNLGSSSYVFESIDKYACTLYVPYGSVAAYKAAPQWKDFSNIVEMPTVHFPGKEGVACSVNQSVSITWTGHVGSLVRIELLNGDAVHQIIASSAANNGSYAWTIPAALKYGNQYKIRVVSLSDTIFTGVSRYPFSVTAPPVVTYPSATGIVWMPDTIQEIKWQNFHDPYVKIELLKGSTVVRTVTAGTPNDGSMLWKVPTIEPGSDYRIRITSTVDPTLTDISNNYFTLAPAIGPKVIYPSESGIVWNSGTVYEITWKDFNDPYVKIELLKGSAVVRTITTGTPNDGSMNWKVPVLETGTDYRIRITSTTTSKADVSDNFFTVRPAPDPAIIYPSEPNIAWTPGNIYEIAWVDFTDPYVKIELLKGAVVVRTITTGTANDGSMLWKAPVLEGGTDYRIQITSTVNTGMTDTSDSPFRIMGQPMVTSPSGSGITWIPGTIYEITWHDFTDPYVKVELLKGSTVVRTISSGTVNDGTMLWKAPALEGGNDYRIRITSTANPAISDISDSNFTIEPAIYPKITYPSEKGIVWQPGTVYEITWQDFNDPYVKIELLKGSIVVRTITTGTTNDGSMNWKAPVLEPGTDYRIRVTSTVTPAMTDISDNFFAAEPAPMPIVIYPSEPGITWIPGNIYEILWQNFSDPYVKIELLKGETVVRTVTTGTANDGSILWKAPLLEGGDDYRIRITSTVNPGMSDMSDHAFSLLGPPRVSYPSESGIAWMTGTTQEITWNDFTDAYVKIELLKGTTVVRTITSGTANDGSMLWKVPVLELGTDYRIRITSTANTIMADLSDSFFEIKPIPSPIVIYPSNPGIVWNPGTVYEITWQNFPDPYVKIELLKGETLVRTVTTGTANDGTMLWKAPDIEPGADYRIRITSTINPAKSDISDGYFSLEPAIIPKITYPSDAGIVWYTGTRYEITWQDFKDTSVRVELLKGDRVVRTIAPSIHNHGDIPFTVPLLEPGSDYRIRITSYHEESDVSDHPFQIQNPPKVIYPSISGIVWNAGNTYEITWQDFTDPYVRLELLKGDSVVRTITTGTPNDGTMLWKAPAISSGIDYRIRVTSTANPGMTDLSDNYFSLSSTKSALAFGDDPESNSMTVYPNPFTHRATISYALAEKGHTLLEIYDLTGRRVTTLQDATREAGTHTLEWNATDANGQQVVPGIYLVRIQSRWFVETLKLVFR